MNIWARDEATNSGRGLGTRLGGAGLQQFIESAAASIISVVGGTGSVVALGLGSGSQVQYFTLGLADGMAKVLSELNDRHATESPEVQGISVEVIPDDVLDQCESLRTVMRRCRAYCIVRISLSGAGVEGLRFIVPLPARVEVNAVSVQLEMISRFVLLSYCLAADGMLSHEEFSPAHLGLTPKQTSVASLVMEGRTNAEIGRQLGISLSTVKCHLVEIFDRLGVSNRASLVSMIHRAPNNASKTVLYVDESVRSLNNSRRAVAVSSLNKPRKPTVVSGLFPLRHVQLRNGC